MRNLLILLFVAVLFGLPACSRNKEGDNYKRVEPEDPAMNEAIAKAKASVGDFLQALHANKPGTRDFYVKKPYPTPNGGSEHMWIEVAGEKDGIIKGTVTNEAEETREVKNGQNVSLKVSEISDWKYQDGNKLIGGFTIRYFLNKMPAKEREALLKEQGFEL